MDAEQLSAFVRARCTLSLCLLTTAGRAPVPVDVTGLHVVRRRLVLLPAGCPPVPRAAPDADEEVRYLHRARVDGGDRDARDPDFVLVDDRRAVRLLHDDHGRFTTAFEVPPASADRYRFRWDLAWAAARDEHVAAGRVTTAPAPPRER